MGFCVDMFLTFNIFSVSLGPMPESVPLALNKAGAERPGRSFRRQTVPSLPRGRELFGPHVFCPTPNMSHLSPKLCSWASGTDSWSNDAYRGGYEILLASYAEV